VSEPFQPEQRLIAGVVVISWHVVVVVAVVVIRHVGRCFCPHTRAHVTIMIIIDKQRHATRSRLAATQPLTILLHRHTHGSIVTLRTKDVAYSSIAQIYPCHVSFTNTFSAHDNAKWSIAILYVSRIRGARTMYRRVLKKY